MPTKHMTYEHLKCYDFSSDFNTPKSNTVCFVPFLPSERRWNSKQDPWPAPDRRVSTLKSFPWYCWWFRNPATLGCIKPCKYWDKLPTSTVLIGRLFHLQASFHPRWLAGFLPSTVFLEQNCREITIHRGFIICHRSFLSTVNSSMIFSPTSSASARKVIIIVLSWQSSNHPILKSKHQDQGPLANKNSMRSDHVVVPCFSAEPWLLWFLVSPSTHLCLCHLGNSEPLIPTKLEALLLEMSYLFYILLHRSSYLQSSSSF